MSTCGECKFWVGDVTNPQDRKMESLDRRPCSAAKDSAVDRARFFHKSTVACRKFMVEREAYKIG